MISYGQLPMHDFVRMPDFSTLLTAEYLDLPTDLETQSNIYGASVCSEPPASSGYLSQENNNLADNTSRRRIDESSIKPMTPSMAGSLVTISGSSQPNFSSLKLPLPSQAGLSQEPPTNSELVQTEKMAADIQLRLTALEIAKIEVTIAQKRAASRKTVNRLKGRVRHKKMLLRRLVTLNKLEANLSAEQIDSIKIESKKYAPTRTETYNRVMRYLVEHPDAQLTGKYPLGFLCTALVNSQEDALAETDHKAFWALRKKVMGVCRSIKSQKIHKEYRRLLGEANGIAK